MLPADIILGTVQFGLQYGISNTGRKPDRGAVYEMLLLAHQKGIRILDTAAAYGDAEETIGCFHRDHTERFLINTKFSGDSPGSMFDKMLERLAVENIHTYFFHNYQEYIQNQQSRTMLQQLKEQQRISYTGVSVYTNEEFETVIRDTDIDVIQLPFNLLDNFYQRGEYMKKAKAAGKQVQVRSVFLQGLFFLSEKRLPQQLHPLASSLAILNRISTEAGIPMETLALQYVAGQEHANNIVIGVDTPQQLTANLEALRDVLPEAVHHAIDSIQVTEKELLYPYNWK